MLNGQEGRLRARWVLHGCKRTLCKSIGSHPRPAQRVAALLRIHAAFGKGAEPQPHTPSRSTKRPDQPIRPAHGVLCLLQRETATATGFEAPAGSNSMLRGAAQRLAKRASQLTVTVSTSVWRTMPCGL